uniref:Dolichol kinase n=1 Tax=Rhabditophanes sp. KR3021 TaxID=114890 RepID=A0AC35UEW4_9BILA
MCNAYFDIYSLLPSKLLKMSDLSQTDRFDHSLMGIAFISFLCILLNIKLFNKSALNVHATCLIIIFCAFYLFSKSIGCSLLQLPLCLLKRVFNGTSQRYSILVLWSNCIFVAVMFNVYIAKLKVATTIHRKYFHLVGIIIAVSGLYFEPQFTRLASFLAIIIFCLVEAIRANMVKPYYSLINQSFLVFLDEQDGVNSILSPIFLLISLFGPLILVEINELKPIALLHFSGICIVGVGDAMAAIIGTLYGKNKWRSVLNLDKTSSKSLQGTAAFFLSCLITLLLCQYYFLHINFMALSFVRIIITSFVTSLCEAFCSKYDNILPTIIGFIILYW